MVIYGRHNPGAVPHIWSVNTCGVNGGGRGIDINGDTEVTT